MTTDFCPSCNRSAERVVRSGVTLDPDALPRLSPTHALERTWEPGERVEQVSGGYGSPRVLRPGTIERIDRIYGYHESLIVAFDDGETRAINPDVMRHQRGKRA